MLIENILGNIEGFISKVIKNLLDDGIDVSNNELDHICYRVETEEKYQEFKNKLSKFGKLLTEVNIGGRPISTYKLDKPILYSGREIFLIELPSPKKSKFYDEGLEHAEFVIKESFDDFMKKHNNLKFKTSSRLKKINPDISLSYSDCSVKFHHKPLEYVIKYEQ